MKKLMLSLLLLLCIYNSQAQTIVKDPNNQVLGYIDGNKFYDLTSAAVLDFSTDGQIKDLGGDVVATYNRVNGQVINKNADLLMTINSDGSIQNFNGNDLGDIVSGTLTDVNGYLLGSAESIDKFYLAYYFLVYSKY